MPGRSSASAERPVTPADHSAQRLLPRLSLGVALIAAGAFLALAALVFSDLRWLFGFAAVLGVFGAIAAEGHRAP
jgi:hypothetical protein